MICNAIIDQSLSEHFQNAAISCVTQKSPNFGTVTFLLTESWYYRKISPVLQYIICNTFFVYANHNLLLLPIYYIKKMAMYMLIG